ncbi:hypothetical protein ASD11_12515 [Aeromicrobium sp. Root495]|uniref:hypothetical protein n=1 Tax=Aeromicrobium sp. Root495 TaxID=1736550 RepID=UPI0006FCB424|nr:hypothetical protein [Aeromicrobium sp. Root495]KQY60279.1 hypothetical protein ASD11_12515 [Aeromicrobium sp. Root495]
MTRNTTSRSLHDLGLAAWFGGTLANAVALNPAAAQAGSAGDKGAVANAGWDRWTPVNAAAIGAHVVGSLGQLRGNAGRIKGQKRVPSMVVAKTALTAAALGVTAYSRSLGKVVDSQNNVPVASGTEPTAATPPDVAAAQKKLAALQWAVPALTGALVVVSSFAGEQERASEVHQGLLKKVLPA